MNNINQILEEGDWVRDILTDKVGRVGRRNNYNYPLEVYFTGDSYCSMTKDGRHRVDDKNPRFIKCDPPKKKVKKKVVTIVFENLTLDSLSYFPELEGGYGITGKEIARFENEFEIEE